MALRTDGSKKLKGLNHKFFSDLMYKQESLKKKVKTGPHYLRKLKNAVEAGEDQNQKGQ